MNCTFAPESPLRARIPTHQRSTIQNEHGRSPSGHESADDCDVEVGQLTRPIDNGISEWRAMQLIRRFMLLVSLMFWQGGFMFYGGMVVPVGGRILGSETTQGF